MDVGRYSHILGECFDDLDIAAIGYVGGGTYRVFEATLDDGRQMIFRFPHGGQGETWLRRERLLCSELAPRLPVAVPRYEFYADGCQSFPWTVAGYPRLSGVCMHDASLHPQALHKLASELGSLLSRLHRIPSSTIQPTVLPCNDWRAVNEKQQALYQRVIQQGYPLLSHKERTWTTELFASFLSDSESQVFEPVMIHGDLDSSNILCDPADGRLLGIIDFEEACFGDPAWDFCVLLAEYGWAFLQAMLRTYDLGLDDGFGARVTFHSQRVLFHELLYGLEHGDSRFSRNAMARLRQAMGGHEPIGGWLNASTAESRSLTRHPGQW
jgi:aminoglycoside 2''-phosphotransferase